MSEAVCPAQGKTQVPLRSRSWASQHPGPSYKRRTEPVTSPVQRAKPRLGQLKRGEGSLRRGSFHTSSDSSLSPPMLQSRGLSFTTHGLGIGCSSTGELTVSHLSVCLLPPMHQVSTPPNFLKDLHLGTCPLTNLSSPDTGRC